MFGLSSEIMDKMVWIFNSEKKISRVKIFGSRALGRQRQGSDIDLAIEGDNLDFDTLLTLRLALEDLYLPYHFDLVPLDSSLDANLRQHIDDFGVEIFFRQRSN